MRVLIVEDEKNLAAALGHIVEEARYAVDIVHDGDDALEYVLSEQYDIAVLDVMLPGLSGFDLVRKMREKGISLPVLLLTARDEIGDKVRGLDCGADDYMTKPFSPEELLARIRALTRRQGDVILEKLEFSDISLLISTYDLTCGQKSVHLGFKEFEVMKILMSNTKMIVPKEDIITRVWGMDSNAEDNNVEAYISFLRKKLSYLGSRVKINTMRKVGYRLEGAADD